MNIASNVLHLVGQSSQGYDVARQDLVRQLNDKIQKDGIDNRVAYRFGNAFQDKYFEFAL